MTQRIFITGASRGLGFEFVRQYMAQGARVFAAARKPREGALLRLAHEYPQKLTLIPLDVVNEAQLAEAVGLVAAQSGALDLLINNAGMTIKNVGLGHYTSAQLMDVLRVNAVAPILIGQAFVELLRKGTAPKLVNVSSQIGSFTWNTSGMSPLYAASKAALNMYTRSFAREATGITTICVHPGWVQTDMGGGSAPLTPEQSVAALRTLIARLTPEDNAQFFNYDGKPHPF